MPVDNGEALSEPDEEAELEDEEADEDGEADEEDGEENGEEEHSKEEKGDSVDSEIEAAGEVEKWPGWPGESVFRLVVPVFKVGGIIGRKGELIKKLCEDTRARIRILDGVIGTSDRIVLISAREEHDAEISPAMDAVLRVFKRINDMPEIPSDGSKQASATAIRLLTPSAQGGDLIGKQGTTVKSIQESTGATIRVLSGDELPYYATADERIVEIQGDAQKVLKALETVAGHLRKFLVDRGVLPLFEKSVKTPAARDHEQEAWDEKKQSLMLSSHTGIGNDYRLPVKRNSLLLDREPNLDSQFQQNSLSLYGQDPVLSGLRSSWSGLGRSGGSLITQVTQTMQIPLSYAEDIIGIGGSNIDYIRRASGAGLTVEETRGMPGEITVEIRGSVSQVQNAQQIIQEFLAGHRDPARSSYGSVERGLGSSYSHPPSSGYSSSLSAPSYGGYGTSAMGGYNRL